MPNAATDFAILEINRMGVMALFSYGPIIVMAYIVMVAILWMNQIGQSSACEELLVCCGTL